MKKSRDPLDALTRGLPVANALLRGPPLPTGLHAKQLAFLALTQLEALYGGAAGGGKTEAILADAAINAQRAGFKALILRRTFPALNLPDSVMNRALQWWGQTYWNQQDKRFSWPVGSVVQFGYCDNAGDLERYKSAQFHKIYIDEVTEWPEAWYTFLFSRIRRLKGDNIQLGMRCATNPDGIGAEWVRRRFNLPEGDVIDSPIETGDDRVFLPARAEDNPSLDLISYEKSLSQLGPIKYQQLRYGRWLRDGEGLVYGHYLDGRNSVPSAPELQHHLLSLDFGFTDATGFCILGWAEGDTTVYIIRCWKEAGLTPTDVAERVAELCKEYEFERIIGDTGGLGKGYAEEMRARWHIPIEPAEKANKRGYIDLLNGALSRGQVRIVLPECDALREEWVILPWHEGRQRESDGFENHCSDAALYGWRATVAFLELPKPAALSAEEERIAAEEARRDVRREQLQPRTGWAQYRPR